MKLAALLTAVGAFSGAAALPTATESPETCLDEFSVCLTHNGPFLKKPCCKPYICDKNFRCRTFGDLEKPLPKLTCVQEYDLCYQGGDPVSGKTCCGGLFCSYGRCVDAQESGVPPVPNPTCVPLGSTCYTSGGWVNRCCQGYCNAYTCVGGPKRETSSATIQPTPYPTYLVESRRSEGQPSSATIQPHPVPSCLPENSFCGLPLSPKLQTRCCSGLVCNQDFCKPVHKSKSQPALPTATGGV